MIMNDLNNNMKELFTEMQLGQERYIYASD